MSALLSSIGRSFGMTLFVLAVLGVGVHETFLRRGR